MRENNDYRSNLRKIILHSADMLPKEIIEYITEVSESNSDDYKRDVLKNYKPLVDNIPIEFVDFIANILILKPSCPLSPENDLKDLIYQKITMEPFGLDSIFGISSNWDYELFDPPAFFKPPFLYLLSKNESEGLRLIHTIVNAATDRWRESEQKFSMNQDVDTEENLLTLLPVTLNLPYGIYNFWGDTSVYCWYRGAIHCSGPNTVVSALMALEYWMEKQIENGRDAEELFEKVLKSSISVAVLGVCISLTLASPKNCLKAALPIVSSPAIWTMDIDRYVHDRSGRFKFPFERNDWDYTLLGKHDGKPHRQLEIRVLATCYLFFSDHSLSQYFEQAVSEFTEKLPFRYQEQKENLEITSSLYDQIKHYQLWGDRSNYQIFKKGEEEYIQFVMPEYKKISTRKIFCWPLTILNRFTCNFGLLE